MKRVNFRNYFVMIDDSTINIVLSINNNTEDDDDNDDDDDDDDDDNNNNNNNNNKHKQSVWDRPGVASDRTQVQSCLDSPYRVAGLSLLLLPATAETCSLHYQLHHVASNLTMKQ